MSDPWAGLATDHDPRGPAWSSAAPRLAGPIAAAGDDPWGGVASDHPPAPAAPRAPLTWGETAADVAKSGGIGVVKGGVGLAGLLGDFRDLANRGARYADPWLSRHMLGTPAEEAERRAEERYGESRPPSVLDKIPTSADVRGGLESLTGPLYEPRSKLGEYAQTIGEFAPGVALGPVNGVRAAAGTALRNVVAPGVASQALGDVAKPFGYETAGRIVGAIGGGLGAAAVGRPATAERMIQGQLPPGMTPRTVDLAEQMMQDAQARGIALTWSEALSQVAGRPVLSSTQRIVESAPQTRARMEDFYAHRPQEVFGAAQRELGRIAQPTGRPSMIGPAAGEAAEGAVNDARQAINAYSAPYYARAEQQLIPAAGMARLRATPGWDEAAAAIQRDPQLARYVGGLPENSVGYANEVKKYLDQAASNARAPLAQNPNMQRAAGYGSDAATVRGIAMQASPDLRQALAIQTQGREQLLEPLLRGPLGRLAQSDISTQRAIGALFPREASLAGSEREISQAVGALAARNPWAASQLVRAHLEQNLSDAFQASGRGQEAAQFGGAAFANRVAGSSVIDSQRLRNIQAAVQALPNGAQTWQGFERFLDVARATGTRQAKGSLTAWNELDRRSLEMGGLAGNIAKEAGSPERWLSAVHDYWGRWQMGRNLDRMATILTDPGAAATLRRLAGTPTGARAAHYLAARVIAQTTSVGPNVQDRHYIHVRTHQPSQDERI